MARRLTKTQRLRRNIKRTIRSLESRGYHVPQEIKETVETGKYQTLEALHRKRYAKLYREITAEVNGKIVSGTAGRAEERRQAAKKAATSWERRRAQQDRIDRESARLYQEGEITMQNVEALISQYPTKGALLLNKMLNTEISKYGREKVMLALAQSPDTAVAYAQTVVFYEDSADGIHTALQEFASLITGTIQDAEEAKEIGAVMDEL